MTLHRPTRYVTPARTYPPLPLSGPTRDCPRCKHAAVKSGFRAAWPGGPVWCQACWTHHEAKQEAKRG